MRIEGTRLCDNEQCHKEFDWMAIVPQPASLPIYDVEKIDKPSGKIIEKTDEYYTVSIRCPKCQRQQLIKYNR